MTVHFPDQLLNQGLNPRNTIFIFTARVVLSFSLEMSCVLPSTHKLKLLAHAFRSSPVAANANGFDIVWRAGVCIYTFHLALFALPATLRPFAYLPPLRIRFGDLVFHIDFYAQSQ
ncbi:hypothetical protein N7466_010758 [Penicillium verhagenii]|uniref:uncharacterized protein n=1 Tax=Penicillium verhagenii TaxID=1562060 RepID=UPI002544DF13|nr:uncharacterized protein N7466_010758 [Penicillium verhagenii]KAJ5917204.1 hypothetical protein N7466_010758 [Penicillium verhagenii]